MNIVEIFMTIYMLELELYLHDHIDELKQIQFQSDEANTDRPLKEYLKKSIEQGCNHIDRLSEIKTIEFNECQYEINDDIKSIYIQKVLLPDEISYEIKELLKARKNAVFTNPDLCLVLNINGSTVYETVELKSTKTDAIPGSSVQQVSLYEWVIFIKHNKNSVSVATGQYLNAVNSHMQFPDRSPRPQVSFSELSNWNTNNRIISNESIDFIAGDDTTEKMKLLTDWQGVLAERWLKIVFLDKKKKSEPWFNNNLRKFILLFINEYDKMSQADKEEYAKMLKNLIE